MKITDETRAMAEDIAKDIIHAFRAAGFHPSVAELGCRIAAKRLELFSRADKTVAEDNADYNNFIASQTELIDFHLPKDTKEKLNNPASLFLERLENDKELQQKVARKFGSID